MSRKNLLGILLSVAIVAMFFSPVSAAAPEPYLVGASISVTGPGSEPLAPLNLPPS